MKHQEYPALSGPLADVRTFARGVEGAVEPFPKALDLERGEQTLHPYVVPDIVGPAYRADEAVVQQFVGMLADSRRPVEAMQQTTCLPRCQIAMVSASLTNVAVFLSSTSRRPGVNS